MRVLVACAASLVLACGNHPSKLDAASAGAAPDPWDISTAKPTSDGGDTGSPFELAGMFDKVAEAVKKPGPYEAPEKSADLADDTPYVGVIELGGKIVEREAFSFSLFGGGGRGTELGQVIGRLRELAHDDHVKGLLLRVSGFEISLPDVIELRAAMAELRAANKTLACHTEDAGNATYLVLAACDRIGIAPLGQIAVTGPAAMPIHLKGLLDKLGVQADFLHVGAYKGAAEPLTRDAPSSEMQETLGAILDRHYQTMIQIIARDRRLPEPTVRTLIDTGLFASEHARAAKLVDEVGSFESFRDAIAKDWKTLELEPKEAAADSKIGAMFKLMRFLGAAPADLPAGDHVAVVYALGNIVDGEGDGVLGARQEIASHTMVAALRALAANDSVKAIVLRIDSGGGSAQASELIWREVDAVKQKKPVIVSMSDVAASGGYYIACGATKIFALDDTLTGSIGVVGGKLALGPALAKLGVNTYPIGRGKRATMMASFTPWNDDEKAVILQSMEEVYDVFTGRVAAGRKLDLATVKKLAQGRVWTGTKAKELGLVDEIGGLDAALAEARKLAKVDDDVALEIYPPSPTLRDLVQGWGGNVTTGVLGSDADHALAEVRAASPELAAAARQLLDLVLSFRTTQIQTVAVIPEVR